MATRLSRATAQDADRQRDEATGFERAKSWLIGVTGILVGIPALVNGAFDVYASLANLPKTDAERVNVELFKKYFNKPPVATVPVPIKQNHGIVEVRFQVFDEGDVYVEYGNLTQWFPFPKESAEKREISFNFISNAVARQAQLYGKGAVMQQESLRNGRLIRERTWPNGVAETLEIDTRTGDVVSRNSRRIDPMVQRSHKLMEHEVKAIDLDSLRAARERNSYPSIKETNK
ncbi:hypothetical protein [Pseudoduganella armeniaca]|uniref:Uncharacterized protein n=1 Tax=Pseudoduganella armeniaca TaxID=2072590 RepID=A0A2R4CEN4_9BURK|nr:hypothetical protein [Pseudoduganella armeniaca]AVR97928.1 hypothetical protein C9I28_21515 [Pseudoduganella armeniaca]